MDPISNGVIRGAERLSLGHITEEVHNQAAQEFERAARNITSSADKTRSTECAELLGYALAVSVTEGDMANATMCEFYIATLLREYRWEDVDATKAKAAGTFARCAEFYRAADEIRSEAICQTNAGLSIVEKHHITASEIASAKESLERGLLLRTPHSEDWAFAAFNLALYWSKVAATGDDSIRNLATAKNYIHDSLEAFGALDSGRLGIALAELARIEELLITAKIEWALSSAVSAHLDELSDVAQSVAGNSLLQLGAILHSNPQTVGVDDTPSWVTAAFASQPDERSAGAIRSLLDRLAEFFSPGSVSDVTDRTSALWHRAKLEWILDSSAENFFEMVDALGELHEGSDPELYFRNGMKLVSGAQVANVSVPKRLLLALSAAYRVVCETRLAPRLELFLRNYPADIRFVACELCEHGEFDAAFDLLEDTRAVLHMRSRESAYEHDVYTDIGYRGSAWVYLTHSPKATYVLVRTVRNGEVVTTGEVIGELSGARLVQLTSSLATGEEGLLVLQNVPLPASRARATASALSALSPIADVLNRIRHDLHAASLILLPSGLFSVFPIQALDTADLNIPYRELPKMVSTTMRGTAGRPKGTIKSAVTLSVASTPGAPVLQYADAEAEIISRVLMTAIPNGHVSVERTASGEDFLCALRTADIVHVSSHSGADHLEPSQSAIGVSDGRVTVQDILTHGPITCELVTLSSCQSGLAGPAILGDEMLSLQSSLLYSGCRLAIGTLWPIIDFVGLLFFTKFYSAMSQTELTSIDFVATWRAFEDTRRWMMDSPVSEIIAFCDYFAISTPSAWLQLAGDSKVLSSPVVWAAFQLSGTDARYTIGAAK